MSLSHLIVTITIFSSINPIVAQFTGTTSSPGTTSPGTTSPGTTSPGTTSPGTTSPPPSCLINNGGCDGNATCTIIGTSVDCECNLGFDDLSSGAGTDCAPIPSNMVCDPPGNGGCAENAECFPARIIPGDLSSGIRPECVCNGPFFEGDGTNTCENIDDCVNATCGVGTCVDGLGNFTCDCGVIAQGDECEIMNNCFDGRDCMNGGTCIIDTVNGNTCNCNSEGFIGILCEIDVDECNGMAVVCGPNSSCRNINGSFACDCDEGYEGDGRDLEIGCTNINECQPVNPCGANADCTDLDPPSGFNCQCQSGFEGDAFDTNGTGCIMVVDEPQNPGTFSDESEDNSDSDSDSDSSSWEDAALFMGNRIKDKDNEDDYDHEQRVILDISPWTMLNIGGFMSMFVCLNMALMWIYSSKNKKHALSNGNEYNDNAHSDQSDC